MGPAPDMRASDHDRDKVISHLRDAHIDGRLSVAEFTERLNAVHAARTYGDLEQLITDIPLIRNQKRAEPEPVPERRIRMDQPLTPPRPGPVAQPSSSPAPRRSRGDKAMRVAWTIWACVNAINLMIWLLVSISSGDLVYFWPVWVAGPAGGVLLTIDLARRAARD